MLVPNPSKLTSLIIRCRGFRKYLQAIAGCLFFIHLSVFAQPKRIAVIGSSTSTGYGLPGYVSGNNCSAPDSWVNKLKKYYMDEGIIDTIYNIAQSSTDCYMGMPSSYVPPQGRSLPNPNLNITKALSFSPKPDVIIVNYPTNSYDWLSITEIMSCLRTIYHCATNEGVKCFIATTQPRNTFSLTERQKLQILNDSINAEFGMYSIDFWTDIVQAPDLTIKTDYSLGDGVHLNVMGHRVLYQKALQRNIFNPSAALPVRFKYVKPKRIDANTIEIEFMMTETEGLEQYFVNLTIDGKTKRVPLNLAETPIPNKKYVVRVKLD
jgi:hypothetical protein